MPLSLSANPSHRTKRSTADKIALWDPGFPTKIFPTSGAVRSSVLPREDTLLSWPEMSNARKK